MENVNKEDFFNLVKKAESEYFEKRPCHFCVGNGCDDCRDCKDAEIDHQMWLEVKKLKDEFKEKFGVSYDLERDIRFDSLVKEKQKNNALEEVYKRCTIEEIIDYGIKNGKNGKTDKLVSLEDVCEWMKNTIDDDVLVKCGSVIKCMDVDDFVLYFRKTMEE